MPCTSTRNAKLFEPSCIECLYIYGESLRRKLDIILSKPRFFYKKTGKNRLWYSSNLYKFLQIHVKFINFQDENLRKDTEEIILQILINLNFFCNNFTSIIPRYTATFREREKMKKEKERKDFQSHVRTSRNPVSRRRFIVATFRDKGKKRKGGVKNWRGFPMVGNRCRKKSIIATGSPRVKNELVFRAWVYWLSNLNTSLGRNVP